MNYDTATAHEILVMAVTTAYQEDYLPVIESALRKAVIREASVGTVRLRMDDGDSCWRGFRGIDHEEDLPDGDYDLIPREPLVTPEELAYMKREIELHENYELNVGKIPEIK